MLSTLQERSAAMKSAKDKAKWIAKVAEGEQTVKTSNKARKELEKETKRLNKALDQANKGGDGPGIKAMEKEIKSLNKALGQASKGGDDSGRKAREEAIKVLEDKAKSHREQVAQLRKQLGDSEERNTQLTRRNGVLESQQISHNPQQAISQQATHYGPSFQQQQAWSQEEAYQSHQLVMANSRRALKSVQQSRSRSRSSKRPRSRSSKPRSRSHSSKRRRSRSSKRSRSRSSKRRRPRSRSRSSKRR